MNDWRGAGLGLPHHDAKSFARSGFWIVVFRLRPSFSSVGLAWSIGPGVNVGFSCLFQLRLLCSAGTAGNADFLVGSVL